MSRSTTARHLHCIPELCHAETTTLPHIIKQSQKSAIMSWYQSACQEADRGPDDILDDSSPNSDVEADLVMMSADSMMPTLHAQK
jgi:hypothetical protein